jgi:hypothetical protein
MTPREIAAKLTPAQVRGLKEASGFGHAAAWWAFNMTRNTAKALASRGLLDISPDPGRHWKITTLGRAVLACLDGEGKP